MRLNLPDYDVKTRTTVEGKSEIFDLFRKKYVALTPEEWVRQHFLQYLVKHKAYPGSLIGVEKGLQVNKMQKRFDAVVYNSKGNPIVLIEFKSQKVDLSQKTFDQISAYNLKLKVDYLIISNGLIHYCCKMDYKTNSIQFLKEIPSYNELHNS